MTTKKLDLATLGGGCFWCIEAILKEIKHEIISGINQFHLIQ